MKCSQLRKHIIQIPHDNIDLSLCVRTILVRSVAAVKVVITDFGVKPQHVKQTVLASRSLLPKHAIFSYSPRPADYTAAGDTSNPIKLFGAVSAVQLSEKRKNL